MLNWIGWLTQRIVLRGAKRMHKVKNQSLGYRAGWNQCSPLVTNNSCVTPLLLRTSVSLRNFTQSLPYGWLWGWKASANAPGAPDFICLFSVCRRSLQEKPSFGHMQSPSQWKPACFSTSPRLPLVLSWLFPRRPQASRLAAKPGGCCNWLSGTPPSSLSLLRVASLFPAPP